ncbi:MAG TPA: hemerythrin domain-containing protein [Polyangia bacterium]|jgi:iron-sulfur cluster repair protein YtfE (RIC family)|nr:hemerythrin domain-containing protein [Polyangia bacterium]
MNELGWSAPTARVDAGTARRGILWQHQRIRELLSRARAIAESALDGDVEISPSVAAMIADLHSTLEVHLAFEERVLLPLLGDDSVQGAQRAQRLRSEHEHQREVLAAIHREASAQPQLPTLAAKLAFLTSWLLADMEEEERCFLITDRVP